MPYNCEGNKPSDMYTPWGCFYISLYEARNGTGSYCFLLISLNENPIIVTNSLGSNLPGIWNFVYDGTQDLIGGDAEVSVEY